LAFPRVVKSCEVRRETAWIENLELLGEGDVDMDAVHKAHDPKLKRDVALKLIRP
jgi:hypothetical protein